MSQLSFHSKNSPDKAPPPRDLPIIQKCIGAYKLWHEFVKHFPKDSKYTLGGKIDDSFIEFLEDLFNAIQTKNKEVFLEKADTKLNILKFFLRVSWEIKAIDNKKYILLSERFDEIGRMLGGWKKYSSKETSAK